MNNIELNLSSSPRLSQIQFCSNHDDLIREIDLLKNQYSKLLLVADDNLASYQEDLINQINQLGIPHLIIQGGEQNKNWDNIQKILIKLLELQYDRKSAIIALGGGVIGDLVGFASSIYQRGIDCIQIPSSLLAMVDSSVGGKTAINLAGIGKNMIGSFHQPVHVLIDHSLLDTLSNDEYINGLAEVIKYAFLRDDNGQFFQYLVKNQKDILQRHPDNLSYIIRESILTKANIVKADEKELNGMRATLNLGHTFGHAIEQYTNYTIAHGRAVSIGMAMAANISMKMNMLSSVDRDAVYNILELYKLPVTYDIPALDLIRLMFHDKKNTGGELNLILFDGVLSRVKLVKNIKLTAELLMN